MRRRLIIIMLIIGVLQLGCKSGFKKGPDIRKVKLDIQVNHFEKDFFALDTNSLNKGLKKLKAKYGPFYDDFLYNIAAFSMNDRHLPGQIRSFIALNQNIYAHIDNYIPHLDRALKEIEKAFKRAKIYFPDKALPNRIITYIGPLDGYGSFSSKAGICVGLQQFLGPKFTGYQSEYLISLYGNQRMRQFTPTHIAPAAISSWINKEFPDKSGHFTLKRKMMEEGKKVYVLKKLLPDLPDSLIFGYSKKQMEWCQNNSFLIKKYFENKRLLETSKPEVIVAYINDNQRPLDLPDDFPNNIGKYLGFIFIKDYMANNENTSFPKLMRHEF